MWFSTDTQTSPQDSSWNTWKSLLQSPGPKHLHCSCIINSVHPKSGFRHHKDHPHCPATPAHCQQLIIKPIRDEAPQRTYSHLKAFKSCCETFNARHVWQRPVRDWSPELLSLTELPGNTSWGKDHNHTQCFKSWKTLWTCLGSSISISQQIRRKQASSSLAETGFPLTFSERIDFF